MSGPVEHPGPDGRGLPGALGGRGGPEGGPGSLIPRMSPSLIDLGFLAI